MILKRTVAILLMISAWSAPATAALDRDQPFPYVAIEEDVRHVRNELARRLNIPVIMDETLTGRVSLRQPYALLKDVLDDLAAQTDSIWWTDGLSLRFSPAATWMTEIIRTRGIPGPVVERWLAEAGLLEAGRLEHGRSVIRVSGPSDYLALVRSTVEIVIDSYVVEGEDNGNSGFVTRIVQGR